MARDYQSVSPAKGVWIPRWMVLVVGVVFFASLALRILKPPEWNLQRLDSPDATMSAALWQSKYFHFSYKIKVKHGAIWRTIYKGSEFEPDFRVNYRPTLYWDEDSQYLLFMVEGKAVVLYDAQKQILCSGARVRGVLEEAFSEVF